MEKLRPLILLVCFALVGCMASDVPSNRSNVSASQGSSTSGSGQGATDTSTSLGNGTTLPPKVEIRHLIEPNLSTDLTYTSGTGYAGGGSYVRKLTLPKNFAGRMYVAGINVASLSSQFVKVRFRFGMGRDPIVIPATIAQAPGITPSSDIQVLVLDLRSSPFRDVRLPYDLYDYNEYATGDTPTQDNRNSGLYCRGLKIEDDPSFTGVGACDGLQSNPSQPEEECLYAYAKVLDQGLIKVSGSVKVPLTPSAAQAKSVATTNFFQDYLSSMLKQPLLDTIPTSGLNTFSTYHFSDANATTGSISANFANTWAALTLGDGSSYFYRGPYRLVNALEWQIQFADLDGKNRLFRDSSYVNYPLYGSSPLPDDPQSTTLAGKNYFNRIYYNSYLFPLATKLNIAAGVPHLSSTTWDGTRSETPAFSTAATTAWMDGSNARATSYNSDLEHLGSCNVSASIEIITKDNNGTDFVVALSKDVKLQLVRPTQYRTDTGNEVLYQNFKRCSSNTNCSGSECCFNNRCWDQSLVSQCYDPTQIQGNRANGDTCASDLECQSLCCNKTSGQCAPHDTLATSPVLCNKPAGDFCIAREWCSKSPITRCLVIRTGTNSLGEVTCRQQCYITQEFGDCTNGYCTPPLQDPIPTFDPTDPNRCNNAVNPPSF